MYKGKRTCKILKEIRQEIARANDISLGLNTDFKPKFLRVYNNLAEQIIDSVGNYIIDVKDGSFPNDDEQY